MRNPPNQFSPQSPRAALRARLAGVAALLALAAGLSPLKADIVVKTISGGENPVNYTSSAGSINSSNIYSQYNQPYASALDAQGNLYVADRNNHEIRKLASPTNAAGRTTTYINLTNKSPVSVAIDAVSNIYVLTLEDTALRKYAVGANGAVTGMVLSNHLASVPSAMVLARDGSFNVYVALTNGSIYSISPLGASAQLTTASVHFKKPTGLAWMPSGFLAVSDAGNNSIWWFYPDGKSSPILLAGQNSATGGFADGDPSVAMLNQPAGLAASGTGLLIVADRGNNRVRAVYPDGSITNLYGTDSSQWTGDYPGWLDSSEGTPEADQPASVTISPDGIIYVTELAYHLIRTVTGTGLSSIIPPPSTPSFSPSCGYFVGPVTITVYNSIGAVYYTKNGDEPAPATATYVPTPGGVGTFTWNDSTLDLSAIKIKAFYGTNSSATISGGKCGTTPPTFSPMSGFFPNGTIITVYNTAGVVLYTVDGSEPVINGAATFYLPTTNGVGYIAWTNRLHDLGYLRIKSVNGIDSASQSVTVRGIPLSVTTPVFYPNCGYYPTPETIVVTNAVGEVHYTTDGSDPTLDSPMVVMVQSGGVSIGSFVWSDTVDNLGMLSVRAFIGETNYSPTVRGQAFCIPQTPVFTPTCGYFPNGRDIIVSAPYGNVYYTTNGQTPGTNSIPLPTTGGIGVIHWTNSLHDLSWLQIKAFNGSASSDTASGEPCPVTAPTFGPMCGYFTNCVDIFVTNAAGEVHYTVDGTTPTLASPMVVITNGVGVIHWCDQNHDLSSLQLRSFSGPDDYSVTVSGQICEPTVPIFGPMSGYYPDGIGIIATNLIGTVHYTSDGGTPTIDSPAATRLANGRQLIPWADALHDLSFLRLISFAGGNSSSVASGVSSPANEVGFTQDYYAGPGSTAIIPLVMNLRPGVLVRTLLLSVDITPGSPNTNLISTEIQARRPKPSDFIPVLRPVSGGALGSGDYQMGTNALVQSGMTRLLISVTSTNAGFVVQDHAVVALICVPLPVAPMGSSWQLAVSHVSATTDGRTSLPLNIMPACNLIVSNVSYIVGNVVPTAWYNGAGAFGDGTLKGSDINAIYYASTGVIVPFNDLVNSASPDPRRKFCDVFDAMDVYPAPNGDGKISFMDSQTILARYWGLDTNVWERTWSAAGTRVSTRIESQPILMAAAALKSQINGNVWLCQARVSSDTLTNVNPGDLCSFPVYVDLLPGCQLAGMQFVASVHSENGAPDADGAQFEPDYAVPQALAGNSPNDVVRVYPMVPSASFSPSLQGRAHLGDVVFQVPQTARPGQAYTVRFSALDGAADLRTPYAFESFPATAWVQSPALRPPAQISDEWKINFFGSTTNSLADDSADPDGDGLSNLAEYIAGTDPTNAQSSLRFLIPSSVNNSGVTLDWLSAPSKSYWVEWSPSLPGTNWTALTNMTGNGAIEQFIDGNAGARARYYRLRVQAP
jgi:hypothetical protein